MEREMKNNTDPFDLQMVPEGIVVQTSNGQVSLLATRIDDKTVIEASRDGVIAANEVLYFCERMVA